jgi:hypothetical protein
MVLDKLGSDLSSYQNSSKVMVMVKGRMSYCNVMGKILDEVRHQVDPSMRSYADEFSPAVPRSMEMQPWARDTMMRLIAETFHQTDMNELCIALLGDMVDEELYTAEHDWHGTHRGWNDSSVPTWQESLMSVYSTILNRLKEGAKILVMTGNKQHLLPGNEPDWHALQKEHPQQVMWMPDISQGSSDLSHEYWHGGEDFGVNVHAPELAALLIVPLNNIVAIPDTATMKWVETAWQDKVTLTNHFLMQNPPV